MLAGLAAVVFAAGLWIRHNAPAADDVGLPLAGSARAAHALVVDRMAASVAVLLLVVVVVVIPRLAWATPQVWKALAPETGASAGAA
ncbi:hypothetical protein [Kitasatospora aureofaciens]|uniref:hypothetical protein n=1 Tax=Kitasatospora aureofaciens TaxID=1894 RepID=UPI0036F49BD7